MGDKKYHRGRSTSAGGIDDLVTIRHGPRARLLGDFYHYFLEASWPKSLFLIALLFIAANFLFALCYVIAGGVQAAQPRSVADAFFFSVQTMATIGYGTMAPLSTAANIIATGEAFSGLIGLALVTGLVFGKFSRPTARVRFSKFALFSVHDRMPCLTFRMANERTNRIIEMDTRVVLIRTETTAEGEPFRRLHDLELTRSHHAVFALSWLVIHPLNLRSPLRGATPESLGADQSSIVVSITGFDDTFSQTVHARHVYHVDEIRWGARFADILQPAADGRWIMDYARFDDIIEAPKAARDGTNLDPS